MGLLHEARVARPRTLASGMHVVPVAGQGCTVRCSSSLYQLQRENLPTRGSFQ